MSRYSTARSSQNVVSPPPMRSSTSPSRTAAGRHYVRLLFPKWPREFHSNLPFKVSTTVFVWGRCVEFGAQAINWIYRLMDDDNAEYRVLFADTDYERLMQELTHGQGVWRRQPSIGYFTTFQMHSLTLVAKVWYNFLCVKIKPTLHLSTVTKDKTILLYVMTKGFQFNIESVIKRGLIESTQGRCTGALIHP